MQNPSDAHKAPNFKKHLKYAAIPIKILEFDDCFDFDIFIERGDGFVLFASQNIRINAENIEKLINAKHKDIYVSVDDKSKYGHYLSQNISRFTEDGLMKRDEKARLVYDSAKTVMEVLFENPNTPESITNVKKVANSIMDGIIQDDKAFASLVKVSSYDYYTYTHSLNVGIYAIGIGKMMGFDKERLNTLANGGILHDLGKSRVDPQIINKPAKLTDEEFEVVKKHPVFGFELLDHLGEANADVLVAIKYHHEKFDGSGYPDGLKGDQIPLFAQIVAVADVFDALNTRRSYKSPMSTFETLQFMKKEMTNHLNPAILGNLIRCMTGGSV